MIGIETIRLSAEAKQRLITLKRRTKIEHWNVLCRWAFCLSLSEKSIPAEVSVPVDSNVEMSWRTFAGSENEQLMWALLKARCIQDDLLSDPETLADQFKRHLHRGIGYLFAHKQAQGIDGVLALDEGSKEQ